MNNPIYSDSKRTSSNSPSPVTNNTTTSQNNQLTRTKQSSNTFDIDLEIEQLFQKLESHLPNKTNADKASIHKLLQTLHVIYPKIDTFKEIAQNIADLASGTSSKRLKTIYSQLTKQFEKIRFKETPQAWIQRADLLDAIDTLQAKFPNEQFESPLLEANPTDLDKKWEEATIPIVPYRYVEDVNKLAVKTLRTQNLHGIKSKLGEKVTGELTSTAKYVRILSKPTRFAFLLNAIYRIMTYIAGNINTKGTDTLNIANTARKLGISSIEAVYTKSKDDEGVMRLHGPKFLFGSSIWNYGSVNDFFVRDLSPEARKKYLQKTLQENTDLNQKYYSHPPTDHNLLAISNADAQVRITTLDSENITTNRRLTGKVLNDESAQLAKKLGDEDAYYTDTYLFNIRNLIGRKEKDPLDNHTIEASVLLDKADEIANVNVAGADSAEMNALRTEALQNPKVQATIQGAQHELLGTALRDYFIPNGATEVIQRLATFNVHNYTASVNGKPMSHQEIAEWLIEVEANIQTNGGDPEIVRERWSQVNKLKEIFKAQEILLDRPSQSTIDIYGDNESVSTPAIQNKPGILSQNDRKIMFFKHEDGNVSMHVFIGATGVNRVDVDPKTTELRQGQRVGDMGFGPDIYKATDKFLAADEDETRDQLPKLRMGENIGGFPINGSTVISYYLPTDFVPKEALVAFTDRAQYKTKESQENIEIQAQMGDALLIKTEIALIQFLETYANIKPMTGHSLKHVIDSLPERHVFEERRRGMGDSQKAHLLALYDRLKKFENPKQMTYLENNLKQQVEAICGKN